MKKKILAFALACSLAFGTLGRGAVSASQVEQLEGTSFETAVARDFDTDYSVVWGDYVEESWNIVTLPENGILEVKFTKVVNDTIGLLDACVEIYNDKGECFYTVRNSENEVSEAHLFAGLESGTYYVKLESGYSSYAKNKTTTYSFSFRASDACELEKNDSKETATPMKVDKTYTGYLGTGYMVTQEFRDLCDLYEVQLKKGQAYKISFKKEEGTTIVKLLGENVALDTLWPSDGAKDFCMSAGDTFIAPYSGSYYLYVYNYSNEQYPYTTKIEKVTLKKTSLTSVQAGKKSFTAKWKKGSCSGYQIQYSTNKNFKNAKTVSVSSKKTSAQVTKLASNKKYYVRIRTYKTVGNDKKVYSSWSSAKSVTTK